MLPDWTPKLTCYTPTALILGKRLKVDCILSHVGYGKTDVRRFWPNDAAFPQDSGLKHVTRQFSVP